MYRGVDAFSLETQAKMPRSEQPCSIYFQTEHVAKLSKEEMLRLGAGGGGGWREGPCPASAWGTALSSTVLVYL